MLRFRVHSSKPLDYLGESLANLVRTRLEASGEVRVLAASATPDALAETAEAQAGDAALRRLAAEVGADYVVTGSVTELAGRYSLDVRATPAAVALRGHTLVLTAERDEELLARVNEVSDGLLAQVVDAAPAVVAKVELVGADGRAKPRCGRASRRARARPSTRRPCARISRSCARTLRSEAPSAETERGPEGVIVRFKIVRAERLLAGGGDAAGDRSRRVGDGARQPPDRGERDPRARGHEGRGALQPGPDRTGRARGAGARVLPRTSGSSSERERPREGW